MDEADNEQNHGEVHLKVDDKKRRWSSFRKGKKQIKKLWKSKKTSKQGDEEHSSHSGDSQDNVANEDHPQSPISTTSSIDPIPYIMLHRPSVPTTEGNNSSPDYMAATPEEEDENHEVRRPGSKDDQHSTIPKDRGQFSLSSELVDRGESNVCMIY